MTKTLLILSLLSVCLPNTLSDFAVDSNGKVFYFNGLITRGSYEDTKDLCESLGGVIPNIHSEQDARFLADSFKTSFVFNSFSFMWLSGKKNESNQTYEWEDGSPFDFSPWIEGAPSCDDECCATVLVLGKIGARGHLSDLPCSSNKVMQVCQVNSTTSVLKVQGKSVDETNDASKNESPNESMTLKQSDLLQVSRFMNQSIQKLQEKLKDQKEAIYSTKFNISAVMIVSYFFLIAFIVFATRNSNSNRNGYQRLESNML